MEPQTNNPVVALIYHGMAKRGMDRKSLGNALSSGGNNAKAFRKLDELLSGTRVAEEFAMRVCNALLFPTVLSCYPRHTSRSVGARAQWPPPPAAVPPQLELDVDGLDPARARIADAVQYGTRGLIVINPASSRNTGG